MIDFYNLVTPTDVLLIIVNLNKWRFRGQIVVQVWKYINSLQQIIFIVVIKTNEKLPPTVTSYGGGGGGGMFFVMHCPFL